MKWPGRTVGLVALVAAAGCSSPAERAPTPADERLTPLLLVRVAEGPMPSSVEAGSVVRARTSADVASRVLAPVTEVQVRAGDRVRQGQVLVVLDGRELASRADAAAATLRSAEDAVRAAEAGIATAAAEQKLAASTFTRISTLLERRSATAQELDQAAAALSAAESRLAGARAASASAAAARDAARAGADAARVMSSYAVLTAPFDGTVAARRVDPGVMATPGASLLTLEDTSALQLEATLDEARASLVAPGTDVEVLLGHDQAAWVTARVVEVARADPASHQFVVKALLPAGITTRTGAFARLRITGPARPALTIPASSLVRRGQLSFVFVPDAEGRARLRAVSVGGRRDDRVEVLAGLSSGEMVVETPPPDLADGRRVAAPGAAARGLAPSGASR